MSSELSEYKAESKAIKNQDLTIRKQEETIRELTAALETKDKEVQDTRQQAAAEADAALLDKMQVWAAAGHRWPPGQQQQQSPVIAAAVKAQLSWLGLCHGYRP